MDRSLAEKTVMEYLDKLYGFALAKTADKRDAEDLAQEIALRLYKALLAGDIENVGAFAQRVARNVLANFYRGKARSGIGICIDELAEALPGGGDPSAEFEKAETVARLYREIAYLSRLQRQIVILYYYEGRKQEEIARLLSVPAGTVKWHLFEAKKDLKKGMETMRELTELKFNPISFLSVSTNGSPGTKGPNWNFLRSALAQNISYAVRRDAKTVNEIADCLGVSPVFVESEAEYLEEYGFLIKQGGRYLSNILISEPTSELNLLQSGIYEEAAGLFAAELFDELSGSDILDSGVVCPQGDRNFLMWALVPYVAALSGEALMDHTVSFEEAATLRPDGGHNIYSAWILAPGTEPPKYLDSMRHMGGPCWSGGEKLSLWTLDTEWSGQRIDGDTYHQFMGRDMPLLERFFGDGELSADDYAYMAERGYLKTEGDPDGLFKASSQIVLIRGGDTRKQLLAIGGGLKKRCKSRFDALKAPYVKALTDGTPKHLRKTRAFELQYMFNSDGFFLLHCLKALVNNGRLTPPPEEQKKSMTTVAITNE